MASVSTKVRISQLILDVESTSNELFDILLQSKSGDVDTTDLIEQLVEKNKQIKTVLQEARTQLEHERKAKLIYSEIEKIDAEIANLDSNLQQAEGALSTMLDSTHASLESVGKALANPLNVDDLIRFAHRISASFAIAAPPDFVSAAVDARRPYPTDIQLRSGWLSQSASTATGSILNQQIMANTPQPNSMLSSQLFVSAATNNQQAATGTNQTNLSAGVGNTAPATSASSLTPGLSVSASAYQNVGSHAYTPFGGASNCEFMSSSSSDSESSADEQ